MSDETPEEYNERRRRLLADVARLNREKGSLSALSAPRAPPKAKGPTRREMWAKALKGEAPTNEPPVPVANNGAPGNATNSDKQKRISAMWAKALRQ